MSASSAPSAQFAYRSLKTIGLTDAYPKYSDVPTFVKPEGNNRCCTYSPDGRWFAWASPESVKVADPTTGQVVTTLPVENVHELGFSPRGSYVITWQRPGKNEDGSGYKNLIVWKTESAERVVAFVQKNQSGWNLQYTEDEKYCARVVTNEVQFFESSKMETVIRRINLKDVSDFALSPKASEDNLIVAALVPERKGQPAMVKIFKVEAEKQTVLTNKSFYKSDRVQLNWNARGTALLVFTQTDADKTGKSYYGETNLYLMTLTGNDWRVQLDKEGPIHDVTWSTDSSEFAVVYGFMPAKTSSFDIAGKLRWSLPTGPRNTVVYSPHARLVLVAGFGNLQGEIDVYKRHIRHIRTKSGDIQEECMMTKITTIHSSNPSICEWSPDGQHILTATTSPRLRVDNGVMIWHYTGSLMYKWDTEELYHVCWRPQPVSLFPLPHALPPAPTPHPSAASHVAKAAPKAAGGAYRPPQLRGSATPLHFKREDEGGAPHIYANGGSPNVVNGFGRGRGRREVPGAAPALPPGAAPGGGVSLAGTGTGADEAGPLSKTALKNKKKREAAKKAKADGDAPNGNPNAPNGNVPRSRSRNGHGRSRSRDTNESSPKGAPTGPKKTDASQAAVDAGAMGAEDKKVRGLLKKLRAIDELKQRLAKGEKLEETQLKKIKTEDGVRKELEALGVNP
ncbi:translation initiation factor eIF-2A [Ascodesmis nigricans]|uniref:Eukaryotic translation initiation factor 2A n=1 Tax=Ascodesmis nigricans TaxID=341454 RepID=A0A4S2MUQ3_9PEZI|nr:translation initiation factor eIF-2A [Ascodesmis nigricans]